MRTIIEQSFTLYNTAGIVDKDKNIYFVPLQNTLFAKASQTLTKVNQCYYALFNDTCPFSSTYQNVAISQWSPEDRVLKIEGLIDDFRVSRGNGLALNYLLVHRVIKVEEEGQETATTQDYYFGMFIDSVEQVGGKSVRLNVSPDHFTNFFYFNNEETLTSDYDPFNPIMKNAYIERQHYDRLKMERRRYESHFNITNLAINHFYGFDFVLNMTLSQSEYTLLSLGNFYSSGIITIQFRDIDTNNIVAEYKAPSNTLISFDVIETTRPLRRRLVGIKIGTKLREIPANCYVALSTTINNIVCNNDIFKDYLNEHLIFSYTDRIVPDNLERILGSEESFKYKYQYKDVRMILPLISGNETTEIRGKSTLKLNRYKEIYDTLREIRREDDFIDFISTLTTTEVRYVASVFVSYLYVQYKENIFLPISWLGKGYKGSYSYIEPLTFLSVLGGGERMYSPVFTVIYPFISIPEELSHFPKSALSLIYKLQWNNNQSVPIQTDYIIEETRHTGFRSVLKYLETYGGSQYVLSTFISKYSTLGGEGVMDVDIDAINNKLKITFKASIDNQDANTHYNDSRDDSIGATTISTGQNHAYATPCFLSPHKVQGTENVDIIITGKYRTQPALFDTQGQHLTANTVAIKQGNTTLISTYQFDFTEMVKVMGFIPQSLTFDRDMEIYHENIVTENNLDSYFDPILDSDPYSFYSLSFLESEQIISKLRYFENFDFSNNAFIFELTPFISFSEGYKIGIVPSYTIKGYKYRYYADSLVFIYSSQLPIIEDSWLTYYATNKAQMKNQYAVQENNYKSAIEQGTINLGVDAYANLFSGITKGFASGAVATTQGLLKDSGSLLSTVVQNTYAKQNIALSQGAKMSDIGAKPDTVKMAGSDMVYDIETGNYGVYINHYNIDKVSYDSIAKYLERNGYLVNIFDKINAFNRIGLNFVKIAEFDFVEDAVKLSMEEMNAVSQIFAEGVTLLHDKDYLHNLGETGYHNIETKLTEGGDN